MMTGEMKLLFMWASMPAAAVWNVVKGVPLIVPSVSMFAALTKMAGQYMRPRLALPARPVAFRWMIAVFGGGGAHDPVPTRLWVTMSVVITPPTLSNTLVVLTVQA